MSESGRVLLTGATGYVGGRLLPALEAGGRSVRCLARRPEELRPRVGPSTEVVGGDVLEPESLKSAFRGCTSAYYLIHSMSDSESFTERERRSAEHFAAAARAADLERIVYLGGLGHGEDLSDHLGSRHQVGEILRESGVLTIEFRASIVIGSGSLSFEMIRSLVDRLPVMVTPRWVRTPAQPIAIEDVIAYLAAALDLETQESRIYEIGGADRVSYGEIMRAYGDVRGLARHLIPVPVLTPRLSSLWLGLVTPIYARVGRKLLEGVKNETVVRDDAALRDFAIRPRGIRDAIRRALGNEDREFSATRWSDAFSSSHPEPRSWGGVPFGSRLVDSRVRRVAVPPGRAFTPIRRLGGRTGWYFGNALWRLRGFLDLLAGGPGLRRGRRHPDELEPGDALDFWRVERVESDRLLRLRAEMKVPGRAWLQFEVEPEGGGSAIRQTALFDPRGLFGLLYWYALWPLHALVFSGMLRGVAAAAEEDG